MIRTVEQLSDALSQQLAWRRKELVDLRYLIETGGRAEGRKLVLARAGVAILYSHWEGFVKIGGTYYLQFIAMQRLCHSELNYNLLALVLRSKLDAAAQSKKVSALRDVAEFFCSKMETRAVVPFKNIVNTEANLSYRVLSEILWILGLDIRHYETKRTVIDIRLLGKRNHIAHGQYLDIDVNEYLELHEEVMYLMNTFRNQIENAAVEQRYKR